MIASREVWEDIPAQAWAAVSATVGGVIAFVATRGRNKADATAALTDAAMRFVDNMQEELRRLTDRLDHVESDNRVKAERLARLEREVEDCENRYRLLAEQLNGGTS